MKRPSGDGRCPVGPARKVDLTLGPASGAPHFGECPVIACLPQVLAIKVRKGCSPKWEALGRLEKIVTAIVATRMPEGLVSNPSRAQTNAKELAKRNQIRLLGCIDTLVLRVVFGSGIYATLFYVRGTGWPD